MRKYELVFIIRPDLDKDAHDEIKEKIFQTISKEEGEIKSWSVWKDKQRFAYSLRTRGAEKKRFTEGTYILSEFVLDPQKLGSLKYILDLEERIIRHLTISRDAS